MRLGTNPLTLLAWICALAIAAFGILAVTAISVNDASAANSSGGISPDGEEDDGDDSAGSSGKYDRLWDKTSRRDRRWASQTAQCESGKDPDAIGGGGIYRGAFQFMKETWKAAPKSPGGDPIDYNYRTQAVVAIALMNKDGAGHWPNCG
jgi:Transglycosylase-like domain